eukprot:165343-Amphidinium_carterae.1
MGCPNRGVIIRSTEVQTACEVAHEQTALVLRDSRFGQMVVALLELTQNRSDAIKTTKEMTWTLRSDGKNTEASSRY